MAYFADSDEVQRYIGGIFEAAAAHPEAGPPLAAAGIVLRLEYTDPEATTTIYLRDPIAVVAGPTDDADVALTLAADLADRYWRGEYNLALGLAKGQVKAKGPVTKILKLVPLTKPLFPIYRDLVADKDAAAPAAA
jgi:hypothetical protein